MSGKSGFLASGILNYYLRNIETYVPSGTLYVALLTTNSDDSNMGTEVADANSYARTAVTFSAPTLTSKVVNNIDVTFPTATGDWGDIVEFAIVDDSAWGAGNVLFYGLVNPSKTIANGDTAKFAIGDLIVTED
jgi:hypothetical protein